MPGKSHSPLDPKGSTGGVPISQSREYQRGGRSQSRMTRDPLMPRGDHSNVSPSGNPKVRGQDRFKSGNSYSQD